MHLHHEVGPQDRAHAAAHRGGRVEGDAQRPRRGRRRPAARPGEHRRAGRARLAPRVRPRPSGRQGRGGRQRRKARRPRTFRDEESGAIKVVYREIVVRFARAHAAGAARAILRVARLRRPAPQPLRARPGRRLPPEAQVRGRRAARDREPLDRARRGRVRDAQLRVAVLAPGGAAADPVGAVAPREPRRGRREATTRTSTCATHGRSRAASASVVVAVLDDGVDIDHPNLKPRLWRNPDAKARDRHGRDFFVDPDDPGRFDPRPKTFQDPVRRPRAQRHPRHALRGRDRGGGEGRRADRRRAGMPAARGQDLPGERARARRARRRRDPLVGEARGRSCRARGRAATAPTCTRRSRTSRRQAAAGSARSSSAPPATTSTSRSSTRRAIRSRSRSARRPTKASSRGIRPWASEIAFVAPSNGGKRGIYDDRRVDGRARLQPRERRGGRRRRPPHQRLRRHVVGDAARRRRRRARAVGAAGPHARRGARGDGADLRPDRHRLRRRRPQRRASAAAASTPARRCAAALDL